MQMANVLLTFLLFSVFFVVGDVFVDVPMMVVVMMVINNHGDGDVLVSQSVQVPEPYANVWSLAYQPYTLTVFFIFFCW